MEVIVLTNVNVIPGVASLIMRHNKEELNWEVARSTLQDDFDIFQEINDYWAYCSENTQSQIFEVYKDIYKICFNNFFDKSILTLNLIPLVTKLMKLHNLDDIEYWFDTKSKLAIPSSICREFDASIGFTWTREKTYLQSDYRKLVPLCIALKSMIPIWEFFISRIKKDAGIFRDQQAYQLLTNSDILKSQAIERLAIFVEHTIPKEHSLDSAILAGISSEEYPTWILSSIVVRNLIRADIRGLNNDLTLITSLHHNITQKVRYIDTNYGGIKSKHAASGAYSGEDNRSLLENFAVREETPFGDIGIIIQYIHRTRDIIEGNIPNTPRSLISRLNPDPEFINTVRLTYKHCQALYPERIHESQPILASWVLSQYIPIRAVPHLDKTEITILISLATAYLWVNGHTDLAALVSATNKYQDVAGESISDSKSRMPRDAMAKLENIYPFIRRQSARSRSRSAKHINFPIDAIDKAFVDNVSYHYWMLNLPEEWITVINGNPRVRRFHVPQDIRAKLANLFIELENNVEKDVLEKKAAIATASVGSSGI